MAVKGTIRRFTPDGGSISGFKSIPSGLVQGKRDPDTGIVYKRPRGALDNGLTSGGSVRIVNPRAMTGRVAKRHGTIGGGLVGDRSY